MPIFEYALVSLIIFGLGILALVLILFYSSVASEEDEDE